VLGALLVLGAVLYLVVRRRPEKSNSPPV
jgi:hypothetical protein